MQRYSEKSKSSRIVYTDQGPWSEILNPTLKEVNKKCQVTSGLFGGAEALFPSTFWDCY